MAVRKIKAGRVSTVTLDQFVGEQGSIFYDDITGEMRLSNGEIIGGQLKLTYELPKASNIVLGGIRVGSGLDIDSNGVVTVTSSISGGANLEIDGGNAFTVYTAEIEVDGGGA